MKFFKPLLAAAIIAVSVSPIAMAGGHTNWFAKADTDSNGAVSKAEFLASKEAKFDKMDLDADGSITKEEMAAGKEKMKAKRDEMKEKHGDMKGKHKEMKEKHGEDHDAEH